MKILLVDPMYFVGKRFVGLGILRIAQSCREAGWNAVIVEKIDNHNSLFSYYSYLKTEILRHEPEVIGLSTRCDVYPFAIGIANYIKTVFPELLLVFGGPQATHTDKKTLECSEVDVVVRGEGETAIKELLSTIKTGESLNNVPGITYKAGTDIVRNPVLYSGLCQDYSCPIDLAPKGHFKALETASIVHLEAGRGCPCRCTFCSTSLMWGRKFRIRKALDIYREMEAIDKKFSVNNFALEHDSLMASKDFRTFLEEITVANERGYKWACSARIDNFDTLLIDKLEKAGCMRIYFGIETGSEKMQAIYRKHLDLKKTVVKLHDILKDGRLQVILSFIYGHPLEDIDDLEKTLDLILSFSQYRSCVTIQLHKLSPTNGSQLYEEYKSILQYTDDISDQAYNKEVVRLYREEIRRNKELYSSFYSFSKLMLPTEILQSIRDGWFNYCRYFPRTVLCTKYSLGAGTIELFTLMERNKISINHIQDLYKRMKLTAPILLSDYIRLENSLLECQAVDTREIEYKRMRHAKDILFNTSIKRVKVRFDIEKVYDGRQLFHLEPMGKNVEVMIWKDRLGTLYHKEMNPLDSIILAEANNIASLKESAGIAAYLTQMELKGLVLLG